MSVKESAIRLVLRARDALSRPVKHSAQSLETFRGEARQLKAKLDELSKQDKLLLAFKKQITSVRQAGSDYQTAKAKVERLAAAYKATAKPTQQLEKQLQRARRAASDTSTAYQKQRTKLDKLRGSLKAAGLSHKQLATQQKTLKASIHQTSEAFERVDKKARRAAIALKQSSFKKVAKDADRASGSIQRLSSRFGSLIAASIGLYTLKRAVGGLLSTGDQFERLRVQLNAIMGSIEGGENAVQWIKQFTRDTPFQLEQVAESFVRLKAFGLDPMDGTLQAIADQASKLGGGMERLNGITLALGQAWAKQKLQGEEILQLVERGVPVWAMLEKATGKNVQQLQKLSTAGKLGQETIKLLIDEIGRGAEGAAAKNMTLLSGYVSNLKDSWKHFLDEVAQSGALDYAKDTLEGISDQISKLADDGRLSKLATAVSAAFIQLGEAIRANFSHLSFEQVVENVKGAVENITATFAGLTKTFTLTGNGIAALFNGFTIAVKSFGLVVSSAFGAAAKGLEGFFSLLDAEDMAAKARDAKNAFKGMASEFADQIVEDANDIDKAFGNISQAFAKPIEPAKQFRQKSKETADAVQNDQQLIQEAVSKTADVTEEKLTDAAESNEKLTKATQKSHKAQKESSESAKSVAESMGKYYDKLGNHLGELSTAAENAFHSMNSFGNVNTDNAQDDIEALRKKLAATRAEVQRLSEPVVGDFTGIESWFKKTGAAAAQVKAEFLEQKIALQSLMNTYENGSISMQSFIAQGEQASRTLDLIDKQQLDQLNQSIEQARQGMEALADSSLGTLEGLQNELDQLQGKTEAVERRRFEARQRDLHDQLASARQKGDGTSQQNIQQAIAVNRQIFDEKRKQSAHEARKRQQKERPSAPIPPPARRSPPEKVIKLDYPGGSVDVGIDPNDESKLLDALKQAGRRSR